MSIFIKKEYREAIAGMTKSLKQDNNNFELLFNISYSLDELGKYNEAIECYDKALKIKPDYADALVSKGVSLHNLGKYNEAIEWYDKALKIKPDYELALNNERLAQEKLVKEGKDKDNKGFFSRFRSNKSDRKIKHYTSDGKPVYE